MTPPASAVRDADVSGDVAIITGVAGFLGSAVARAAAASGRRVVGVVRATSPRANLADFPGDIVTADLRNPQDVSEAFAQAAEIGPVAELFHVAADYRLWARDPEEIVRNNRDMTRAVMEAALARTIPRVVYTSSVATLLPIAGRPSNEDHPATPNQATGAYKRSKVIAERMVEQMVATRGLPAVIVNPSTPIGPRDVHPTPTGRVVVEAANGKMPAYVDTGMNLVHVEDVADGHLLASEWGAIGRRYVLGGEDVTLGRMIGDICALVGRPAPRVKLPVGPLFPLAYAAEAVARITGREPFVTVDSLRMARHHMYYSSARAHAELGYTARPYTEALADAAAWFRQAGMIR